MRFVDRDGALVAGNAVVLGQVVLARGVSVWYGAVIRGDLSSITVGEHTNIQDGCVLHCDPGLDLVIGRQVTVGHQATVHAKSVGDRCLIGIQSILLSGAVIGEGSIIAAGALVKENQEIPPRSVVVGIPGRVIGKVTDAQLAESEPRAMRYHDLALRHLKGQFNPI